jgi:uncharacterized phiE125 gp8 family phage protein
MSLVTPPEGEPVSLETAKLHLRIDHDDEDEYLFGVIAAAREVGEEIARRAFVTQTRKMVIDAWPADYVLKLLRPPLQSVTSVEYTDDNDVVAAWTDFRVDIASEPGRILFDSLPSVTLRESGGITVTYVAGYGNTGADVPNRIKNAILSLVAYWYENRESRDVPAGIRAAFMNERVVWF